MARDHEWFEFTTIGAIYLVAAGLLGIRILGLETAEDLTFLTEYPEYVIAIALPLSYVIGATVTTSYFVLYEYLGNFVDESVLRRIRGERVGDLVNQPGHVRRALLLQRGSPDLVREYYRLGRRLQLFRSVAVAASVLVWSFVWWVGPTPYRSQRPAVLGFWAVLMGILFVAHWGHTGIYYRFSHAAVREVDPGGSLGDGGSATAAEASSPVASSEP